MERKLFNEIWRIVLYFCLVFSFVVIFLLNSASEIHAQTARQNYYSESLPESTITGTLVYQDKVTLTFTPDDNSTYVLLASWSMATNNTGASIKSKLTRTTGTPTDFNEVVYFPRDILNYISGGAVAIDTFGSNPGSQTYKIQFAVSNTGRIAKIKDARIIAIKLTSADVYAEVDTRTTTKSITYVDKTTLSITPDSTGDYIILSSAIVDSNNTGASVKVQMNIDGTPNTEMLKEPFNVNNRYFWGTMKKVNLDNSAHNITIQYSINNASRLGGIAYAKIVALRADRFLNNYYNEDDARTTAVNPLTYQTKTTLTATPQAQDHLIIGTTGVDMNSTSIRVYSQLLKDTTPYSESQVEPQDVLNRGLPYFVISKESLLNTSTSWYTQFKASGNSTAGIASSRILVLELNEPSFTVNVASSGTQRTDVFPGDNDIHIGGAFTFVRNSGSTSVNSITINNTGTISSSNISDLVLFYKQEATCSTSIPVDATQFNSTPGTFSSGSSTVTGTMNVGTSQVCLYARLDVGSGASSPQTIEIQISNPSTGVLVSAGNVTPASAVVLNGTTTVSTILAVDIVDASNVPVSSPSFGFSAGSFSFFPQTTNGTFGSSSQKVYVTSGPSANWQLTIAATNGATSLWSNTGATKKYDFNDSTANAVDGGDADTFGGQLSLSVSTGSLSPGGGCSNTGLSLGSNSSFVETTNNSITLVTASSGQTSCNWSLTGIGLTQSIPKEQGVDNYSINLTLTITAT